MSQDDISWDTSLRPLSRVEAEDWLKSRVEERVATAILAVAMYQDDRTWAHTTIESFLDDPRPVVRGNALLGMGYIARIDGFVDYERLLPVLTKAFTDPTLKSRVYETVEEIVCHTRYKFRDFPFYDIHENLAGEE